MPFVVRKGAFYCRADKIILVSLLIITPGIILGSLFTDPHAVTGEFTQQQSAVTQIDLLKSMPYAYFGGYNPTSPPIVTGNSILGMIQLPPPLV